MKRIVLLTTLMLVCISCCLAQRIESTKNFGGYWYSQNGTRLNMNELVNLMEPDSEAYDLMRSARSNSTISQIISIPAGALIGWPLGSAIGGGDPQWGLAAAGAGLLVLAIPISSAGNRKAQEAIALYNGSLSYSYSRRRPTIAFISTSTGVGLGITF